MKLVTDSDSTSSSAAPAEACEGLFGIVKAKSGGRTVYISADRVAGIFPGELLNQTAAAIDGIPALVTIDSTPGNFAAAVAAARISIHAHNADVYFARAAEHADSERAKIREEMNASFSTAVNLAAELAADDARRKEEGREPEQPAPPRDAPASFAYPPNTCTPQPA